MAPDVLDADQRDFVEARRRAILVTLSANGLPRPVPICFALAEPDPDDGTTRLYSPLDEKPKRVADVRELARVRDIVARPDVTLLFERWSEDWSQLAWLRARGRAALLEPHDDVAAHRWAAQALRTRYPQYRAHNLEDLPMLQIDITEATAWNVGPG